MIDVARLELAELRKLDAAVRRELASRRNGSSACAICDELFVARQGAVYCSARCRVAAHRKRILARHEDERIGQMQTVTSGMIGVGYEGITLDELVAQLRGWNISTLVDVRLNAVSRKRGFSKTALAAGLAAAGINYVHLRSLGNPRDNRAAYADAFSTEGKAARDSFRSGLERDESSTALRELAELSRSEFVAVFCYEKSELNCHRREVLSAARALLDEVVAV